MSKENNFGKITRTRVERFDNPFSPQYNARYVTGSDMKRLFAQKIGIPLENSAEKIGSVTNGEEGVPNIFRTAVVKTTIDEVPYPTRIASRKAFGLVKYMFPRGDNYIVSDVVWCIQKQNGERFYLNKPSNNLERENELAQLLIDSKGDILSSDSGFALLISDLHLINYYHASLKIGRIRGEISEPTLLETIHSHPIYFAGLSLESMINNILIPKKEFVFQIKKINLLPGEHVDVSGIMEINIKNSDANYLFYKLLAIGIIPPNLFK